MGVFDTNTPCFHSSDAPGARPEKEDVSGDTFNREVFI